MNRIAIAATIALLAGGSVSASAKEPVTRSPSTHWNLEYDAESCRLSRNFGEGDDLVALTLTKFAPDTRMEVLVGGQSLAPRGLNLKYAFLPSDDYAEAFSPLYGDHETLGTVWQFSSGLLSPQQVEDLREAEASRDAWKSVEAENAARTTGFMIASGVKQPVVLDTGSMTSAMKAMDTCLDDLVSHWGYDAQAMSALQSEPLPATDFRQWVRPSDYPTPALRSQLAGSVRFRVHVAADGTASNCVVQSAFSDPAFREATCEAILTRAEFKPALDADGNPVNAYWVQNVLFRPNPVR